MNVNELWSELDVLIYSPTISAGVSFDKLHFDIMFGVICDKSCTERDYHQMLRRVRKIKSDNILILNYSSFQIDELAKYKTYEETRDFLINMKDVNLKRKYIHEGKTTKQIIDINDFDEIYIYNKTEEINSEAGVFLKSFLSRATKKGYD